MDEMIPYAKAHRRDGGEWMVAFFREFVFLFSAMLLVFTMLFRLVVVSGDSMNATLINGDCVLLLSNLLYREPQQGDIVVISKQNYENGKSIIKRVIATEGQRVDIDFDKGIVYVDGSALNETYTNTPTNLFEGVHFPITVDEGCIFVLGDNRNGSKDSRNPAIGQIDSREVVGKAVWLIFPGADDFRSRSFNRIGVIS